MSARREDQARLGREVLEAGRIDGPEPGPGSRDHAYPLALDIDDAHGIAAVSFAILDMYPKIERGWWCEAITFARRDGEWEYAGGDTDNTTAPGPFSRPDKPEASMHDWCDWHSIGGISGWDEDHPPEWRNTFFGIAPTGTARLTVTDETGRSRDLRITPW